MELIASSNPSDVERYRVVALIVQRAVLTRMVCRELEENPTPPFNRFRVDTALSLLMDWILSNPEWADAFRASFGIETMTVPADCLALFEELKAGAAICDDVQMLQCSDTASDYNSDAARIMDGLAIYRDKHGIAACLPRILIR